MRVGAVLVSLYNTQRKGEEVVQSSMELQRQETKSQSQIPTRQVRILPDVRKEGSDRYKNKILCPIRRDS